MKNVYLFKTLILVLNFFALHSFAVPSDLLEDEYLNQGNYAAVRIWNSKKLSQGHSVGHAALQVFENYIPSFNASLYPDESVGPFTVGEVKAYWQTVKEDEGEDDEGNKHHSPNEEIYLYSLNRFRMKTEFDKMKQTNTYYMLSTGGSDAMFAAHYETFARNCASMVRDLLNFGGLPNFYEKPTDQSAFMAAGSIVRHGVPAVAKTTVTLVSGIATGLIGGTDRFIRGIFRAENPFGSAVKGMQDGAIIGAKAADVIVGYVTGTTVSEHLSILNYGHPYGECSLVTPWKIRQLAKDAREQEKRKFPRTSSWKDSYSMPVFHFQ